MYAKRRIPLALWSLLSVALVAAPATAQFTELLNQVPESANTIALLNADKVLGSEVALREGWRTNFEKAISAGLTRLPVDTKQFVMAAETDFEFMHPIWQVGIVATTKPHSMSYIASERKGTQDTINGKPAVSMPSGNYVVQFAPTIYGTLVPAARQAVARWITASAAGKPNFTPYIQEAIRYSEEAGTEIIMAMDLTDVLNGETVTGLVKESKILADAGVSEGNAVKVLASLRGVMLGITFGETPFGSIKVDFGEDTTLLKSAAKPLLLHVLANHGAMIDDFDSWTVKAEGTQIRLSGKFSATGLRQVFSLFDPPTASSLPTEEKAGDPSQQQQDSPVVATQKYFAAVNEYIRDLRNKEPQRIAQYGIWFDKYARKIDQLPMVNVDDEMLDYGAYVSQQFRNAGTAIQGIGSRSRVRQVQNVNGASYWGSNYDGAGYSYGGFYYNGGWGGAYARNAYANAAQQAGNRQQFRVRTQIKTEERVAGANAARAIVKDIDEATAQVRRTMTKKYNAEF